jgi:hypothetical protein
MLYIQSYARIGAITEAENTALHTKSKELSRCMQHMKREKHKESPIYPIRYQYLHIPKTKKSNLINLMDFKFKYLPLFCDHIGNRKNHFHAN